MISQIGQIGKHKSVKTFTQKNISHDDREVLDGSVLFLEMMVRLIKFSHCTWDYFCLLQLLRSASPSPVFTSHPLSHSISCSSPTTDSDNINSQLRLRLRVTCAGHSLSRELTASEGRGDNIFLFGVVCQQYHYR